MTVVQWTAWAMLGAVVGSVIGLWINRKWDEPFLRWMKSRWVRKQERMK